MIYFVPRAIIQMCVVTCTIVLQLHSENIIANRKEEKPLIIFLGSLHSSLPKGKIKENYQTKKSSCKEDIWTENC